MNTIPPPSNSPQDLAELHSDKILGALAQKFPSFNQKDMVLLPDLSFDAEDGTVGFLVRHSSGMYGVNAKMEGGDLADFKCVELP